MSFTLYSGVEDIVSYGDDMLREAQMQNHMEFQEHLYTQKTHRRLFYLDHLLITIGSLANDRYSSKSFVGVG